MLCLHSFPFLGWFLCDECVLVLFAFCVLPLWNPLWKSLGNAVRFSAEVCLSALSFRAVFPGPSGGGGLSPWRDTCPFS